MSFQIFEMPFWSSQENLQISLENVSKPENYSIIEYDVPVGVKTEYSQGIPILRYKMIEKIAALEAREMLNLKFCVF